MTPVVDPTPVPIYFDSALIAKFYLNEPGREQGGGERGSPGT